MRKIILAAAVAGCAMHTAIATAASTAQDGPSSPDDPQNTIDPASTSGSAALAIIG